METLALVAQLFWVVVIGCVGYCVFNLVEWIFSLFGGVCFGC